MEHRNTLWEFKCYSPFTTGRALGNGSAANGGAPSTSDGHVTAQGCTLEHLTKLVKGLKQIGIPGQRPYDRVTPAAQLRAHGRGYVAASDGQYVDALRKRRRVILAAVETSGGWNAEGIRALGALARRSKRRGGRDGTAYGTSATATRSFFLHHLAAISAAVVFADAATISESAACALQAATLP